MISANELRQKARVSLKGHWLLAIVATAITTIIGPPSPSHNSNMSELVQYIGIAIVLGTFILGALNLGLNLVTLSLAQGKGVGFKSFLSFFRSKSSYFKSIEYTILYHVYIWLWTLAFIIPGIVKSYSYALSGYILIENPSMSANGAITKSKEMMDGNKSKLFGLWLNFFGWYILVIITLFTLIIYYTFSGPEFNLKIFLLGTAILAILSRVALFFIAPYYRVAEAHFYQELKPSEHESD